MPVTKLDEYLIHQIVSTMDHVVDSDPRWYDRYWINVYERSKRVHIVTGMATYPNTNVIDGHAAVVYGGFQYNVRASRPLNGERMDTEVGPIAIRVIKGLRTLHLLLGENDLGIAYDLTYEALGPPHESPAHDFGRWKGRVIGNTCGLVQCGRVSGWVKVGGQTFEATPETWGAARDRLWGIRYEIGGPQVAAPEPPPPPHRPDGLAQWEPGGVWLQAQFSDRYIYIVGNTGEVIYQYGDPRERVKVVATEHQMEFHPGTIKLKGGESTFTDEHGKKTTITTHPWSTFYLAGANYGGFQGYYRGQYHPGGYLLVDKFDLSNPEVVRELAARDDHASEFRIGKEVGYGVLEIGIRGQQPYAPYEPPSPPAATPARPRRRRQAPSG